MELTLRITLQQPPPGVPFAVQRGKEEIVDALQSSGCDLTFEVPVAVKSGRDGSPDFSGPFVQGPPGGRFVYICSGKRAGGLLSPWERRAKVPLGAITWELIRLAERIPHPCLAVSFAGTMKDGGPVCTSIRLIPLDWRIE